MESAKWTYHKEQSFANNNLFFFEIFVSTNEPLIKSWLDVQATQMSIFVLFVSAGDLFEVAIYFKCPSFQVTLDHKSENQRWFHKNGKTISYTYTFVYKQVGSGPSPQSCLYFQGFWGSKLFNGCLVVWPSHICLGEIQ